MKSKINPSENEVQKILKFPTPNIYRKNVLKYMFTHDEIKSAYQIAEEYGNIANDSLYKKAIDDLTNPQNQQTGTYLVISKDKKTNKNIWIRSDEFEKILNHPWFKALRQNKEIIDKIFDKSFDKKKKSNTESLLEFSNLSFEAINKGMIR